MKRGSDLSDTVMCDAQDVDQQHQQQHQDQDDDIGNPKEAQYLSANCVLFMSYTGDAASVVDEHFSRALHQQQQQQDFNSESSVVASTSTSVDVAKGSVIIKGTSCHHTTHYLLLSPPPSSSTREKGEGRFVLARRSV